MPMTTNASMVSLRSHPSERCRPYADPVRTDGERRAKASRIANSRRHYVAPNTGERWLVFTVASTMAIAMLPVVVVVATITLASVLWRHCMQDRGRQRASVTTARSRISIGVSRRRRSSNPGITAKNLISLSEIFAA